ncbi:hypothetical protein [Dactylosporangium salmoneum]|uniref:BMP family ABC transporter substrate-binding protein n=1 Tax=Dactylosporangium salmoneum TaxID=53361 RepID=A0ABP5TP37_9ACTN
MAAAVLVVAVVVAVLLWLRDTPPPPRERAYLAYTACLLTPSNGVADPDAAPAWSALQEVSLSTRAKVQYLAISGPQTLENALTFVNSLAASGCDLIFAAGPLPVQAVAKGAATFPDRRFVTLGGTAAANISTVNAAAPHDEIVRLVADGVRAATP